MLFKRALYKNRSVSNGRISLYSIISLNYLLFLTPESLCSIPLAIFSPIFIWIIYRENLDLFLRLRFKYTSLTVVVSFLSLYVLSLSYNYDRMYTKNLEYYLWPIFSLIMVFPVALVFRLVCDRPVLKSVNSFLLIFSFILFALIAMLSDGRFRFGFGPNMLYRIVLFNFLVYSIVANRIYHFLIALPAALIVVFATGSRGGVIAILFIIALYVRGLSRRLRRRILLFFTSALVLSYYYLGLGDFFAEIRVLNFSIEDNNRLVFYRDFWDWLISADYMQILLGSGFRSWPFEGLYPHNIFMEVFHGYGILFFLLFTIFILRPLFNQRNYFLIMSMPFFVGSLVSGALYDNVVALGFMFFSILFTKGSLDTKIK